MTIVFTPGDGHLTFDDRNPCIWVQSRPLVINGVITPINGLINIRYLELFHPYKQVYFTLHLVYKAILPSHSRSRQSNPPPLSWPPTFPVAPWE